MTDLVWPEDLAPYRVAFYLQPHVGGSESPFSRQRKVYGLSAPRWIARLTFRGGYDGGLHDGASGFGPRLDALVAELEGGLNRVAIWDWRRPLPIRPQMTVSPAGLTNAGAATGATTMAIAGFSPHAVAFSAGDYVGGDGRAHIVLAPCRAGGDGVATVVFKPPLSSAVAAGSPAVTKRVSSPFRLTSDDAGQNETEVGGNTEYALDFVEDLE